MADTTPQTDSIDVDTTTSTEPATAAVLPVPRLSRGRRIHGSARAVEVAGRLEMDSPEGSPRRFARGIRFLALAGSMSLSPDPDAPLGQDPTTGGTVLMGAGCPGGNRSGPGEATRDLWRRLMALPFVDGSTATGAPPGRIRCDQGPNSGPSGPGPDTVADRQRPE